MAMVPLDGDGFPTSVRSAIHGTRFSGSHGKQKNGPKSAMCHPGPCRWRKTGEFSMRWARRSPG